MIKVNPIVDAALRDVQLGIRSLDHVMDVHYNDLYDYYLASGEMPIGVAKARTGDPDQWIVNQLEIDLGLFI